MTARNKSTIVWTIAAVAMATFAFTMSANAAVYSFNMGNGPDMSGDVAAANNPNGLQITGEGNTWANIWTATPSATEDGVTLTFTPPDWGGTVGDSSINMRYDAIRNGTFLANEGDIPWTLTGLAPNAYYDMIWYNKRGSPTTPGGENRAPNTGVTGFDAGNGVGASGPHDADKDQNFVGVQADGSGAISGTWFLAGGLEDITAVAGVQVTEGIPEPSTLTLLALGLLGLIGFGRRRRG